MLLVNSQTHVSNKQAPSCPHDTWNGPETKPCAYVGATKQLATKQLLYSRRLAFGGVMVVSYNLHLRFYRLFLPGFFNWFVSPQTGFPVPLSCTVSSPPPNRNLYQPVHEQANYCCWDSGVGFSGWAVGAELSLHQHDNVYSSGNYIHFSGYSMSSPSSMAFKYTSCTADHSSNT